MARWFRFYDDAVNDPKVQRLEPKLFKAWINMLCLASQHDGWLPAAGDVAFTLRVTEAEAGRLVDALVSSELLDEYDGRYTPHNWKGRQYQSDSSVERVKRHRAKRAANGLQAQWTAPKELRRAVYERDGHKCVYCGSGERLSLDHRTPETRGGTHDPENLATACLACNGAKRDLTEQEFRERNDLCNVTSPLPKRPQSTEQITEQKEDTPSGVSPPKVYAFEDGVIRLNQRDFDAWAKAFSHIELSAELLSLSQWASTQGDKWFHAVKGALAKRNREVKQRADTAQKDGGFKWMSGIEGVV